MVELVNKDINKYKTETGGGFKGGGGGEAGGAPPPPYFLQSFVFCNHFEEL